MRYSFLLHLIFGIVLLSACENDPEEVKRFLQNFDVSIETASDVEILYSDSAFVKVRVIAPTMLSHLDKQNPFQEFPDGVAVDFFSQNQRVSSKLTAKYALRYEKKNQIIVRDSVIWHSINKEKIESEELIWDEATQKIYTNKFVVITRPDEIIYGHGFEANQDFTYTKINAIEGRLKVEDMGLDEETSPASSNNQKPNQPN